MLRGIRINCVAFRVGLYCTLLLSNSSSSFHHYAAVVSRGGAKASACRFQITLSCAFLCHIVSLQYLSRSSLHRLAGLPCRLFLSLWSPSGDTRGPSVVFEAVDMPCPGPFHFSYSVDYIYDFCPLPDPDVGLPIFVCDVEHTSFHFGQIIMSQTSENNNNCRRKLVE